MCKFKTLGVSWPPLGWDQFESIQHSHDRAMIKDPMSAMVRGLSYVIEPIPVFLNEEKKSYIYSITIEGWEYNIYNESREYPVLSFILRERTNKTSPKSYFLSDIRSLARPVKLTERSAQRAFMGALFLMKQINSDIVPDVKRILRLYKIHPTQRSLYEIDNKRTDSMFRGLSHFKNIVDESETA